MTLALTGPFGATEALVSMLAAQGVEISGCGPLLSALVEPMSSGFHLTHRKVQGRLDQLLRIRIGTGAINAIRCRLSEALAAPVAEAAEANR